MMNTTQATQTQVETETQQDSLQNVSQHAHWTIRFALASVFIFMGIDKFMGGGLAEFSQMMDLPVFISGLVALAEIGGGLLIIIGGFTNGWVTRLGALAMIPVLLGAIFMVHWGQWHFMPTQTHPMGGMMFQVTLFMLAVYMLIRGNNA